MQIKKIIPQLFCLVLLFTSCQQSSGDQKARMPKQYTSEQLRNNVAIIPAAFNDNETTLLVSNNESGLFNVHEINIADTVDKPLTSSTKESLFAVAYLPGNNHFIYSSDKGGNENDHLYLMIPGDTSARDITPWPESKNSFNSWSANKESFYINSNKRNPQFFDLWKIDTTNWQPKLIYQNDSSLDLNAISNSERYLALSKSITADKNELYLIDRVANTRTRLSNDNEATWNGMAFEKNDSIFYYSTNDGSEFSYLVKYNLKTGQKSTLYKTNWDVMWFNLSENEKYHTIGINEDGKNKIIVFDHSTNQPIDFPDFKDGSISNTIISNSENDFLLQVGSSTSSPNLYVYNMPGKKLKQLTSTLNKEVDENDLVKAEVVRFTSFDGKEIPAIYYKPLQASQDHKAAALVWVHGGPGGQSRIGFSNSIQFLVNHGYAVLEVNNRGSNGYGKTFYKLDNRDHGYGDLQDCIWGKNWLAEKDYIDSNAIGIYGGSYGGNMVLNALALHPDEFKVGVNLFGVANWLRTLRSIPPYWESFKKALYDEMGDPNTADSIRLKEVSPLMNYEKITKPLLVFQGANDVRVLKIESDEIVAGVKKNGVPVEYVVYPDEGHGVLKKENMITTDNKTLAFLNKYLKTNNNMNANKE